MNNRHRAREIALQILYRENLPTDDQALIHDLKTHFDHFKIPEELREFAAWLVAGTVRETATLDEQIKSHMAAQWKIERLASLDRTLLRMALFELKNGINKGSDTTPAIVIDEAIELAKQFGSAESPAFINGILDNLKKTIQQNQS